MKLSVGNGITVELIQVPEVGTPWQVRVYKKLLGFKRQISCDWFLEQEQARKFAGQLANELQSNGSLTALKLRQPGWTLHRPVQ